MSRYIIVNIVLVISLTVIYVMGWSWLWYAGVVAVYIAISAYGTTVMSAQLFMPARCGTKTSSNHIAITFDDGPIPGKTTKVLDILREHNTIAAFFCIGHRVKDNGELMQRIHREGHLIGNHSYWHGATFDLLPAGKVEKEMADTDAAIFGHVGVVPRFFRPPYGVTNPMLAMAVDRRQYTVIGWSVRSFDTVIRDRQRLMKRVTRSLKGGDVVLFHDFSESTIDILPDFLNRVSELGLKIVRVDELLNEKAYG